jgi:hypothetical protein
LSLLDAFVNVSFEENELTSIIIREFKSFIMEIRARSDNSEYLEEFRQFDGLFEMTKMTPRQDLLMLITINKDIQNTMIRFLMLIGDKLTFLIDFLNCNRHARMTPNELRLPLKSKNDEYHFSYHIGKKEM